MKYNISRSFDDSAYIIMAIEIITLAFSLAAF